MTEKSHQITDEQQKFLENNPYFKPVSFLDDGDLLILDPRYQDTPPPHEGYPAPHKVYVLTWLGVVQGAYYHFTHFHDLSQPVTSRQPQMSFQERLRLTEDIHERYLQQAITSLEAIDELKKLPLSYPDINYVIHRWIAERAIASFGMAEAYVGPE